MNAFIDAARKAGIEGPYRFEPDLRVIVLKRNKFFIDNAFREYTAAQNADGRAAVISRYMTTLTDPASRLAEWKQVAGKLLPLVRPRSYFEFATNADADGSGVPLPTMPFTDSLRLAVAQDNPETTFIVTKSLLKKWSKSFTEAMAVARTNLKQRSTEGLESISPGLYESPWHDAYDASRLIFSELFDKLEVKGDVVVMIPVRETLFATGSDDPQGLEKMLDLADEALKESRALSNEALVLKWRRWVPFMPPPSHPLYERFRLLSLKDRDADYEQQAEILSKKLQREERDVFVASYTIVKSDKGKYMTYCVWTKDIPTLLPRTEYIAFATSGDKDAHLAAMAPWDKVQRLLGHRMHQTTDWPARFMVSGWPTADQLRTLDRHRTYK